MELVFLGTGAGMPSKERNVTAIALQLNAERGSFWLFDCGEGTQHQIMHSSVKLGKLEKIFITHLHGDHLYGLPGLLTSRSYQGGDTPLTLIGPPGVRAFLETALQVSQAHLEYELIIEELDVDEQGQVKGDGRIFEDDHFVVEAALLEHRIESYGYRICEKDKPGRLLTEKLEAEGLKPGPLYARFKKEASIALENGRILQSADYLSEPIPGRIVAILGDTRLCEGSKRLARNADVLVHEATFAKAEADLAHRYYHATSDQAARLAVECGAGCLIMTHFSSRYKGDEIEQLVEEAREHLTHAYAARDHWTYVIPRKIDPKNV
ncbi:ribonuclease Z [Xylanibacillus composti]|uniref:Ribonuclease Z n=1 Tax=Xylanibacillus composti TaxID=1572762 RepID=A0A8J4H4Y3_9BACL|nr:ribonuclease Z [Xylanibacillus composti]MDT9724248.1 ribonuclease Z [Xylanibacillus composti]GIQ69571.1 ribonuclease Z [Xylanibacillus composti]